MVQEIGNQNFDTFDTLNIYVFKGNGAAGMDATFDGLMGGSGDEPDSMYGLVAQSVRYTADKLTYRFKLRPEARFNEGKTSARLIELWARPNARRTGWVSVAEMP